VPNEAPVIGKVSPASWLQSASTASAHHTVSSNTDTNGSQMTQIRLTVGDQSAIATLADNPTAGDFADLLPVTLNMSDLQGTEKPGALPRPLDASGAAVFTYEVGQIGYWAPGQDVAVVYAFEGNGSIPSPRADSAGHSHFWFAGDRRCRRLFPAPYRTGQLIYRN